LTSISGFPKLCSLQIKIFNRAAYKILVFVKTSMKNYPKSTQILSQIHKHFMSSFLPIFLCKNLQIQNASTGKLHKTLPHKKINYLNVSEIEKNESAN